VPAMSSSKGGVTAGTAAVAIAAAAVREEKMAEIELGVADVEKGGGDKKDAKDRYIRAWV
jgi:hypothetical protein